MTRIDRLAVMAPEVALVPDRRYPKVLAGMIGRARARVWASLFMLDLDVAGDPGHAVMGVLNGLAAAQWRGIDVRLIVSGSRDNYAIAETAATAVAVGRQMGIPTRWLGARARRGSHAKFVIADDEVLLGSHNWSPSAFLASTQDSTWLQSPPLASYLGSLFAAQWSRAPRKEDA
jgi:phosphatidylserine/phosphatidylglycerophosphate/cardiolipin synthase-like enzyme